MLRQLRYDFSMFFKRTPFLIICSILILYIFLLTFSSIYDRNNIQLQYYGSAYMANLIMSQSSLFRYTSLVLVFPLIVAIPIGIMMIKEKSSLTHILIRKNKKVYIISKLMTSFIIGFLMMFMTVGFAILFGYIIFGEEQSFYNHPMRLFFGYSTRGITTTLRYYNLYFLNPVLYLGMYSLLSSIMMGIVAQLTMVIALFTKFKVVIYGGVFMLSMLTVFVHPMVVPFYELLAPYCYVSNNLMNAQYFYPIAFFLISIIAAIVFVRKDVMLK
ncbi:hypothetical protein [Candidatus Stoquefichus sp. SB1]|uniref:hypothetical protein n=1 Tax=Candidatus Stoquefichus sp. SB1 TaxID=1658109 RepID=UPI00067EE77B|nr:hypothetical protein [Candidatus Stoquefichus sp. SB1]